MVRLIDRLRRHHWDLAFVEAKEGDWLFGDWTFKRVKYSTKNRWFADPFILDVSDETISLLVEEFSYKINKGRIARLIIDRKTLKLIDIKILLDMPTHLSFPAIIRIGEAIYVYPENSASGQLSLYKYNRKSEELELESVLVDQPLTDAVIETILDKPWLFSTAKPNSNGCVLTYYSSDSYIGHYSKVDEIIFKDKIARNAGSMFSYCSKVIRPAQISNEINGYGSGISFQEVSQSGNSFFISEVCRKYPPKGYNGMHTFNIYGGMAIVDCRRENYHYLIHILRMIKHIFSR